MSAIPPREIRWAMAGHAATTGAMHPAAGLALQHPSWGLHPARMMKLRTDCGQRGVALQTHRGHRSDTGWAPMPVGQVARAALISGTGAANERSAARA